ncbi:MAG: tRNA (adenosine(37)-N6)-dimethylallyltransferase MiaA [Lachnospiraceae bacterium]|nr:tRNA (adenosine(37)-N6)-dimethylallyltransferase MiaA [Lachnospiraceae bacterium]MCM1239049.1 tRNA (adenosine(37)-N6)-dimethylallyltransferase MiaA [Lachnospiraceae bacterium]
MPDRNKTKPPMIVLTGPTAVGKTRLSLALAEAVGGEIISADSMQVYRHMDIGSAKIAPEEMRGIPHHMIDILEPWEAFNVVIFQERCKKILPEIYDRGHIPIVTGGTGFYIQAILRDIDFTENEENSEYRACLEELAAREGAEKLHEMLLAADPEAAKAIHPNNIKRTIRALEYHRLTGQKISLHNEQERQKPSAYNACYFVLSDLRERLYERIEQRIDEMLAKGLVAEVERLRRMGCHRGMVSMQGLGYKEILAYLEGEYTCDQAVEILKRDTRHFAKRQLTWFRRESNVIWINKNEFGYDERKILEFMLENLQKSNIYAPFSES